MGCLLIKTDIFKELSKPWFDFQWTPSSNDFLGEDMYLCQKITAAGYSIKIDTIISQELHHLGTFAFNADLLN